MQIFKKIIERLEELKTDNSCRSCQYREKCNEVQETASESTDLCGATMKSLAIEIVNQVASEYGDKTTIDGQYCWQTCACTEMCDKCNRLSNGEFDYYDSIEPYKAESEE